MTIPRGLMPGALTRHPASHPALALRPYLAALPVPLAGLGLFLLLTLWLWGRPDIPLRGAMDMASTLIFAFTGALVGLRHRPQSGLLRWLALSLVAGFLTANGGGTVRTLLLGRIDFFWWADPHYLVVTAAGALLALYLDDGLSPSLEAHWDSADRLALGVFVALGAEKAQLWPGLLPTDALPWLLAIGFGALTGAGGGLIRDLLLRRAPSALVTSYGTVAVIGAACHVVLYRSLPGEPVWVASGILTWLLAEAGARIDRSR